MGEKLCFRCGKMKVLEAFYPRSDRPGERWSHCKECVSHRRKAVRAARPPGTSERTPTQQSWSAMVQRCTNPKRSCYAIYGGRGICICERWRIFTNFLADMGERPAGTVIDRIDPDGNYEPSNCRWLDSEESARNTRVSARRDRDCAEVRKLILSGICLCEAARRVAQINGGNAETLRHVYRNRRVAGRISDASACSPVPPAPASPPPRQASLFPSEAA